MDDAKSNRCNGSFAKTCDCYKVASLNETILDANLISVLKDRYVLGEQLGWGQFGIIRACTDKLTGEALACKSVAKCRLVTSGDVRSIRLEIEIMTRLSGHLNVVDLKAVYEDEDFVHLVMELCAGGELYNQLEKHGRFSESEARGLFKHLMQVVSFCHENGVVHRDLKPENILLATKSSLSQIKLADFGLATYIKPGQKLQCTVGSPFYIAPEVLAGGYDQAADVWSAGVILYILLCGMPPFWGKTKSQIFDAVRTADLRFPADPWNSISESAKDLVKKMLHTNPSQRLTAEQVLEHSWMEYNACYSKEANARDDCSGGNLVHLGAGGASFSSSFICRSQDISFSAASSMACEGQSSEYACKSSFSAFIAEPSKGCSPAGGFSFQSNVDCNTMESTSLAPSMLSFEFFSPVSLIEPPSCSLEISSNVPEVNMIYSNLASEMEQKVTKTKRANGTGSKLSGIQNKRNRTIGLGEREPLDIMVTESVIRWSSCTLLPTSLGSSLVC